MKYSEITQRKMSVSWIVNSRHCQIVLNNLLWPHNSLPAGKSLPLKQLRIYAINSYTFDSQMDLLTALINTHPDKPTYNKLIKHFDGLWLGVEEPRRQRQVHLPVLALIFRKHITVW